MTTRLAAWSGPRNISTALMRSWENRADTVVVDEPFYASYLQRTGLQHPGRDDILAAQPTEPDAVIEALLRPSDVDVQYSKQMAHHLPFQHDLSWLAQLRHVLVIRDPLEVVASYVRSREACEPEDIGLLQQQRLLTVLPATPRSSTLLTSCAHRPGYLRWLCAWLDLDFTPAMLAWPAGSPRLRRRLGPALVRRRRALDRLRDPAAARHRPHRARPHRQRGLPPGVRHPARAAPGPRLRG